MERISSTSLTFRLNENGAPFFTDMLFSVGVLSVTWCLPSCECHYRTLKGDFTVEGIPLSVPQGKGGIRENHLYMAVNRQYSRASTFSEFLEELWILGVCQFDVDYISRTVTFRSNSKFGGLNMWTK